MSKTGMKGPPVWRVRTTIMMETYDHIAFVEHKARQAYSDAGVAMGLGAGAIQRIELIRGGEVIESKDWRAVPLTPAVVRVMEDVAGAKRRADGVLECPARAAYGALMWGGNAGGPESGVNPPKMSNSTNASLEDLGL